VLSHLRGRVAGHKRKTVAAVDEDHAVRLEVVSRPATHPRSAMNVCRWTALQELIPLAVSVKIPSPVVLQLTLALSWGMIVIRRRLGGRGTATVAHKETPRVQHRVPHLASNPAAHLIGAVRQNRASRGHGALRQQPIASPASVTPMSATTHAVKKDMTTIVWNEQRRGHVLEVLVALTLRKETVKVNQGSSFTFLFLSYNKTASVVRSTEVQYLSKSTSKREFFT